MRTNFRFLLLAPVIAYGLAWSSHFFMKRNKPAIFLHFLTPAERLSYVSDGPDWPMEAIIQKLGKQSSQGK